MTLIANTAGQLVLDGAVTTATFRGPPVVVVGAALVIDDPRWVAALALATAINCPVIGAAGAADLASVRGSLLALRRFWRADQTSPAPVCLVARRRVWGALPWAGGAWAGTSPLLVKYPPFCGPLVLIPRTADEDQALTAWDWAATVARSAEYHPYGTGLAAVSSFLLYHSPPLYAVAWGADPAVALTTLRKLWAAPPAPSVDQYTALAAANALRPGLDRLVHPSLVGAVRLARSG